jgi:hypothetical protein
VLHLEKPLAEVLFAPLVFATRRRGGSPRPGVSARS